MKCRISEHDEFLLNQLIDGDLGADEQQELRARIEREPELRAVHDQLTRLNQTLIGQSADEPAIDYDRFHDRLMAAVAEEVNAPSGTLSAPDASGGVIRFPTWLRVAAPLAAAAVIALVVAIPWQSSRPDRQTVVENDQPALPDLPVVEPDTAEDKPTGTEVRTFADAGPAEMPTDAPQMSQDTHSGKLIVRVSRPAYTQRNASESIQVSVVRSNELAARIRELDQARRNRPQQHVFFASAPRKPVELRGELLFGGSAL